MQKFKNVILVFSVALLISCGTPNEPESIIGGDGGYKIVSKFITSGYAQDVVVEDTVAFVGQGEGGLMIINIGNPYTPVELSTVAQELKGYAYKIARKDSVIYVAAGAFGVSVVDVSDPENPGAYLTNISMRPAKSFEIMGNFLFTAVAEYGIRISFIGYPLEPDLRGEIITPGFAQGICATSDSNYLLVACGEMGFAVMDISELGTGEGDHYPIRGWVDTPGYAEGIAGHPTLPYAFIASGNGGLLIADYSDSANIKIVGSYTTGGYAKEVIYKDNKVYVTTELRGLQIFDVTNINSPMRIGTVETKYAMGLAVDDKYVYVADEEEGLVIISIP